MAQQAIERGESLTQFRSRLLDKVADQPIPFREIDDLGLTDRETRSFSLAKAIQAKAENDWSNAGFEAEVAHKFGAGGIRGLTGYAKTIIQCFGDRQEKKISIVIDNEQVELPFFSLSIANGAQWGNNFEIASKADIQDGLLDIAIMKKPK